ncbi:hypothetical protein ACFYKX_11235 [Cytobacillus sp. FJAT-54145]|uniref:Uncharacterized protein n=1 Tax=Cytobacillus spartinae TaxID=3299023 RepID=A0ABW6KED3_9BACI
MGKPVEDRVRFEIRNDEGIVMGNADIYQVREFIEAALLSSELQFHPTLQEFWNEDTEELEIFMHSDNWEDEETQEQYAEKIKECEDLGFSHSDDSVATESILSYLGLSIHYTHMVEA